MVSEKSITRRQWSFIKRVKTEPTEPSLILLWGQHWWQIRVKFVVSRAGEAYDKEARGLKSGTAIKPSRSHRSQRPLVGTYRQVSGGLCLRRASAA